MNQPNYSSLEILIEPETSAFSGSSGPEKVLRNAKESFEQLGIVLSEAARDFKKSVEEVGPDELQLGLNLYLEAEGKWLVVAGKAGATASVTLTWRN